MANSEKFCLKWNDFQDNVNTAFVALRKDSDFTDVTLACEDGHQIEAHKIILAASSPFFQNILRRNKHKHPLIYIGGCLVGPQPSQVYSPYKWHKWHKWFANSTNMVIVSFLKLASTSTLKTLVIIKTVKKAGV